jgi:hypothetical protein
MKPFAVPIGALVALVLASAVAAQPATSAPSLEALAQARHLIQTMHAEKLADQLISSLQTSIVGSMSKSLPEARQQQVQAIDEAMLEEVRGIMPKVFDQMAVIYATDFTEQELTDIDRFYASPTGQSMLAKMPRISQQLVPFVMAQMPALLSRAFDRACERTSCTAEQHAAIAKAIDAMKARVGAQPS